MPVSTHLVSRMACMCISAMPMEPRARDRGRRLLAGTYFCTQIPEHGHYNNVLVYCVHCNQKSPPSRSPIRKSLSWQICQKPDMFFLFVSPKNFLKIPMHPIVIFLITSNLAEFLTYRQIAKKKPAAPENSISECLAPFIPPIR